ncbi:Uncharacterised protein [[Flavobacterium] thermophilum]|nr:Uncharacterised protein [[Flavobacterium] thermophilum]
MKIKFKHLLVFSILLINVGLLFGYKLQGRFAVSNVFQILSFIFMIPVFLKTFKLKHYIQIIAFVATILGASWLMSIIYDYTFKVENFVFFLICFIQLICIYSLANSEENESILPLVIKVQKTLIIPVCLYLLFYAANDVFKLGLPNSSFGFDDKSHAVIILQFYAFITFSLIKSNMKYIISLIFLGLSLLTISRLAVIFLPFYIIALIINLSKNNKNFLQVYFKFIFVSTVLSLGIIFLIKNQDYFKVFERVNSVQSIEDSDSTLAHIQLIKYGVLLKFDNLANFLLGVTPGGFAPVLAKSDINFSSFFVIDPAAYRAIYLGIAPMHSTHFSIFTEFPIYIFVIYLVLLYKIAKNLLKKKLWVESLFFFGFLISTTFYSTHNELLFYGILIYLIIVSIYMQHKELTSHPAHPKRCSTSSGRSWM